MMQMNTIKHSSNAMLQVFDFLHKKGAPHKKLKSSGLQDLRRPKIGERIPCDQQPGPTCTCTIYALAVRKDRAVFGHVSCNILQ